MKNRSSHSLLDPELIWYRLAILAWGVALFVIVLIFLLSPEKVTGMDQYLKGARAWLEGKDIYSYKPNKGFVYSPIAAVFFSALTLLPKFLANILWRLSGAALLLCGSWAILRFGPFITIPRRFFGLFFLLLLPLSLSNVDCGQANPHVIGLMMIGLAAAFQNRWLLAAIAIVGAVYLKVYPLTLALLLILLAPWQFTMWFGIGIGVFGLLPFLFQTPSYVWDQYKLWIETRIADNRLRYSIEMAPLDLWFVAVRLGNLPVSEFAYNILRVVTGGMIAGYCLIGRWKSWPRERLLGGMFCLLNVWIVLLGPATEIFTYLLLAPCATFSFLDSLVLRRNSKLRVTSATAYCMLLLSVIHIGFFSWLKSPWLLAIQPIAALVYLVYVLLRYLDGREWRIAGQEIMHAKGG